MIKHAVGSKAWFCIKNKTNKKKSKKQLYFAFILNNKLQASETFEQESAIDQHYYVDAAKY